MRLVTLADECRRAGLHVFEVDGWQGRGPDLGQVGAVLAHHTATGRNASDAAVDRLLRDGRPDLPGPLAQVGLNRAGVVRIIAAGRANHAGSGTWRGVTGNSQAVGVESYNDGVGEVWPAAQLDAWDQLNAVLLRLCHLPADALCGHKEWAPTRKIDPRGVDMPAMRNRARHLLTNPPTEEIADVTPDQDRKLTWLFDEFSRPYPNLMGLKDAAGKVYADTPVGVMLWARAEAWHGMQASRQAVAEIAGLRAAVAAMAGGDLTVEQVTAAAKDGAAAALDARIENARVEITPKDAA